MACLEKADQASLEQVLDVVEIIASQRETSQKLYDLAQEHVRMGESGDNPQLFIVVEEILKPFYLVWRKKYDQIKELMRKESLYTKREEDYFNLVSIRSQQSKIQVDYSRYYGAEGVYLAHDLRISQPGIVVSSSPKLFNDRGKYGYEERFKFETSLFRDGNIESISVYVAEDINHKNYHYNYKPTRDSFWIEGQESFVPPRQNPSVPVYPQVGRFFTWSLSRDSVIESPINKRLYEES